MTLVKRRFFIQTAVYAAITLLWGCGSSSVEPVGKLTIGIVSYDSAAQSVDQYQSFRDYLSQQTQAVVELEPAFNELQALQQIQRQNVWSLVFAPPGLAAIAIEQERYSPIFTLQGSANARSVLLVLDDSPVEELGDLAGQSIALGEPGSATGYYLPLYDLYGLTLSEVVFAPTPRTLLEWISDGTVTAGALSEEEYQEYRNEFTSSFRVLHTSRPIPQGVVLVGPTVERNQQRQIEEAMKAAPSNIIADAGYLPTATLPDYSQFIQLIEKVTPLEEQVRESPAVLTITSTEEGG
ncbi:MAG: phosphate/phosphite/phosphonate ABC transporter substrate-binding protein [Cyanobacteria bacterium J06627_8]